MTYTIRFISFWRFFLTALTPICLFLVFDKPNGVVSTSFLFAVIIIAISFLWLPRFTATAVANVTIEDEGLSINWQKQFLLQNTPGLFINWNDIKEYKYQPSTGMEIFRLTLKNGQKIMWQMHSGLAGDDDFSAFLTAFQKKVNEINSTTESSKQIEKEKTIYETRLGLVLAIIYVFALVAIPVAIIVFPPKGSISYAPLILGYVALIYHVAMVIKHRKAKQKTGYS
jgi:hypothetical protein